ncbi:MAG: hypothetical protein U0559_00225 [Anaerolineae bacterium]
MVCSALAASDPRRLGTPLAEQRANARPRDDQPLPIEFFEPLDQRRVRRAVECAQRFIGERRGIDPRLPERQQVSVAPLRSQKLAA